MGIFQRLFGTASSTPALRVEPAMPRADAAQFMSLDDPRLIEFMRAGPSTSTGIVTERDALANPAVFRSVSLISNTIGMLPLHLIDVATKEKADDHPLFALLHREPNNWQTAYDFRSLLQMRALVKGDGYALIVRSRGKVLRLVPLDPDRVDPKQNPDWTVSYRYTPPAGGQVTYRPEDILHLRGLSQDGIRGLSLVRHVAEAVGLARTANLALGRLFRNGSFVNATLNVPAGVKLGEDGRKNLKESWNERFAGAENAGKTPLLEDGVEFKVPTTSAKDAQSKELLARQDEEIARVFGVPRPLLMVDETSWGTGIDALGQFFVRYGLNPWFEAWQQAIERSLFTDADKVRYSVKFNAGALLRGSMQAQGQFFAWALGQGGGRPWMTPDDVRDLQDMPKMANGAGTAEAMAAAMAGHNGAPPINDNEAKHASA